MADYFQEVHVQVDRAMTLIHEVLARPEGVVVLRPRIERHCLAALKAAKQCSSDLFARVSFWIGETEALLNFPKDHQLRKRVAELVLTILEESSSY